MGQRGVGYVRKVAQYDSLEIRVRVGRLVPKKHQVAHYVGSRNPEAEHSAVGDTAVFEPGCSQRPLEETSERREAFLPQ